MQRFVAWLTSLLPEPRKKVSSLVPEVDPIIYPESTMPESTFMDQCPNAETHHPRFIPFPDFDLCHLPERWRHPHVLQDIRDIAQRVVKLRLRKTSPNRFPHLPDGPEKRRMMRQGHHGTGFVTYDRARGVVVHTSKHVIFDPFEALHTDVIFFCDREGEGVKCKGIKEGFRTVLATDYSSFALEQPLPPEVVTWLKQKTEQTFSWRTFSLSRLLDRQSRDTDVVVISHPHGSPKKVSIGKMSRRQCLALAMYSATTCPGSSGAPVLRLSDNYRHYLAAGQVIHHGHDRLDEETATGIGSLRPPFTVPYFLYQEGGGIRSVVTMLFDPVSFWSLYLTDILDMDMVLFKCTDNFCYFLTFYGFFCGWQDPWTLRLFWTFLVVLFCQMALYAKHGLHIFALRMLRGLYRLSMHWVTWLACFLVPRDYHSLLWVTPLWLGVWFFSRQVRLSRLLGMDLFQIFLKESL